MSKREPRIFEDKLAERDMTPLLVGLTSPSGAGKTLSAIRLAIGMQKVFKGEIFHIDTEAGRAKHYSPKPGEAPDPSRHTYAFRHVPFSAPFGPLEYLDVIRHCAKRGAGVIIVDSMSHEHEGPGGVLEMHAAEEERLLAKGNRASKWSAWNKPKSERRALINGILQLQIAFIFCFRSKPKLKPAEKKNQNEESKMDELGWMPIAGEEFVYELTISLLLGLQANGVPNLKFKEFTDAQREMFKVPGEFEKLFKTARQLDEAIGEEMALWATGGQVLPEAFHADRATVQQQHHETTAAASAALKPGTGPDVSAPCATCAATPPKCVACKRVMAFRKEEVAYRSSDIVPARWVCTKPEKNCTLPTHKGRNTNQRASDYHVFLTSPKPATAKEAARAETEQRSRTPSPADPQTDQERTAIESLDTAV